MKHLLDLDSLTPPEVTSILDLATDIKTALKSDPAKYQEDWGFSLEGKTMLMLFEKPSLRTRISFEVGMTQLGGHAIFYTIVDSPLGKKESIADTAKVISRMCDITMARLFEHDHIIELAENSTVPVINALTDWSHPCQILSDLLTIREHFGKTKGLTLAYVGDCNNNVTHSLMQGCPLAGINVKVGGPSSQPIPVPDASDEGMKTAIEASSEIGSFQPHPTATEIALKLAKANNTKVEIFTDPVETVKNADIVYADSWMSYGIPDKEREERFKALAPFQVTSELMSHAKPTAIFMNCLPAMRGEEQTAEVIDGPQSIVFPQAENRLHCQKAIILKLLDLA